MVALFLRPGALLPISRGVSYGLLIASLARHIAASKLLLLVSGLMLAPSAD
jgi:hypothetical protein